MGWFSHPQALLEPIIPLLSHALLTTNSPRPERLTQIATSRAGLTPDGRIV
jgi:hypothetical protein